jgi:hypothetical protein
MIILDEEKCPECRRKKLREPHDDDPVYLLTKDAILSASIEDILAQNKIPCIKRAQLGAGLTAYLGYSLDTFRFYVPFGALDAARDLLSNFIEPEVEPDEQHE